MIEPEVAEPSRVDQSRGPFFDSIFVRGAIAFARETALDEAAHIARVRLAGDEAGRFAARMIEKKRQPLFPGAPTSVGEGVCRA